MWGLVVESLGTQRLRSALSTLGIAIGIASVLLLSSIGSGTRSAVMAQFAQFGTTVLQVGPGKQRTFGVGPGVVGGTTHPLTLEDADALRRAPGVQYVAPHTMGLGSVEADGRSRRTYIYGTVWEDQHALRWYPRLGTFLPRGEAPAVCVLGATVARELFAGRNPLGERVRVGEARFTVIGVMSPKGQALGFDMDDMVFIPVRRAMKMFNRDDLPEIHVLARGHAMIGPATREIRKILRERHDGEEDFTITNQADMLRVVDEVMGALTVGLVVIAGISVLVGAMGILTMVWVTVNERTAEIGLIKALGASDRQVLALFLAEASALSLFGGACGVAAALLGGWALSAWVPVEPAAWAVPLALGSSMAVGLVAGILPALRAARLDPVEALRAE